MKCWCISAPARCPCRPYSPAGRALPWTRGSRCGRAPARCICSMPRPACAWSKIRLVGGGAPQALTHPSLRDVSPSPALAGRGPGEGLEILAEPQRVIDRRMNIAAGYRIADAEELELALRVGLDRLRLALDDGAQIHLAAIARMRLEGEIELVHRQRAMLDDELVDDALLFLVGVFVLQHGYELVALAIDLRHRVIGRHD